MGGHRTRVIQRAIQLLPGLEGTNLMRAVHIFHHIEQQDLTQDEFVKLTTQRQRFMPLLGRFSMAKNTTLRIGKAGKSVTGDFALTQLQGKLQEGVLIDEENKTKEFYEALYEGRFLSFQVNVLVNSQRVKSDANEEPSMISSTGSFLEMFTHEMTAHAEPMLDLIEDYWEAKGHQQFTTKLASASADHHQLRQGQVTRFEYMSARIKSDDFSLPSHYPNLDLANIRSGYESRLVGDFQSMK